ncbi:MAG: cyclic pyranopterin monophosphate synthase MoaC [Bacteroidota bacterium]
MSESFSHLDAQGNPSMVDVSQKNVTERVAIAESLMFLPTIIMDQLQGGEIQTKKGPVFHTAIIAGTQAVKQTANLIPLCHPLMIEGIKIHIEPMDRSHLRIRCRVKITGKTGVEMEALTGASVAALTIYDMCKAFSHEMIIKETKLVEKTGGKRDIREGEKLG